MINFTRAKMLFLIPTLFLLMINEGKAQEGKQIEKNLETYRIVKGAEISDIDNYMDALNKADFSYHRLRNETFTIRFENGLEVEIFSATTLQGSGLLKHDLNFYPEKYGLERYQSVFKLGTGNSIIELRTSANEKVFQK